MIDRCARYKRSRKDLGEDSSKNTYMHINTIKVWDYIIDREINLIRG